MAEYATFVNSIADEIKEFKARQAAGVAAEDARCVVCVGMKASVSD